MNRETAMTRRVAKVRKGGGKAGTLTLALALTLKRASLVPMA